MLNLSELWQTAALPPDRRSIEEWAFDNINLPPVLTKRGKFSTDESRHFEGPLAALRSDRVRGVRILKPVRGGGSLIADVFVPWVIVNDSASVLWVFQDDTIAESHAELRQWPILMSVPAIRPMLPSDRHKLRKDNIVFANGLPLILQGPAIGGLQSKGFKVVVCDEPWLYKAGILGQAKGRMGDFVKNASNKFLAISQGGEEDSDWDLEYKSGVEFIWHVHCAGCNQPIAPEWTMETKDGKLAGVVFDSVKHEDGTYDKDASAATVRFVCLHCGHEHSASEKTRSDWNKSGEYYNSKTRLPLDANNLPTECSFRWHALIDYPWRELVKEWLSANEAKHVGNFAPLITFFQKRCAVMRSERTIHEGNTPFARAKIELKSTIDKLDGELARFLTADRQSEDTYWVTIRAWFANGESRRLWFGKLYSEADIEAKRIEYGVNPDCTVVDSGYRPKGDHGVYAACIRYGWIAVKGTDEPFFWHMEPQPEPNPPIRVQKAWAPLTWGDPGEGTTHEGRNRCPLIRFSAPTIADRLDGLIKQGLWVEPETDRADQMEREYRVQMSAEFKRPKLNKFTGHRVMVWVCPSGNNHAFDCGKMQVLCAMHAKLLPQGIELSTTTNERKQIETVNA